MIFIVQSQNNLQKIASLNISFSYSISKGCAVKFRPFTSSALNRSIARWSRGMPIRKYCEAGEGPESRAHSINSYLQDCEVFWPISKFTRRICLKLCMWLYLKNLRTFFCWRFSRKIHFVGFFCVFLVFFHLFSSLINQWPNQRPFSPWRKARSGKVHFYENHQRSTVFRTV